MMSTYVIVQDDNIVNFRVNIQQDSDVISDDLTLNLPRKFNLFLFYD